MNISKYGSEELWPLLGDEHSPRCHLKVCCGRTCLFLSHPIQLHREATCYQFPSVSKRPPWQLTPPSFLRSSSFPNSPEPPSPWAAWVTWEEYPGTCQGSSGVSSLREWGRTSAVYASALSLMCESCSSRLHTTCLPLTQPGLVTQVLKHAELSLLYSPPPSSYPSSLCELK